MKIQRIDVLLLLTTERYVDLIKGIVRLAVIHKLRYISQQRINLSSLTSTIRFIASIETNKRCLQSLSRQNRM